MHSSFHSSFLRVSNAERAVCGVQMICSVFQCNCRPTICPQIITVGAGVLLFTPWASSWSLLPAPKGSSYCEWWSANAGFFQVLSRGQRMFFPRACHFLSSFLRIDISVVTVPQVLKVSSVRDFLRS